MSSKGEVGLGDLPTSQFDEDFGPPLSAYQSYRPTVEYLRRCGPELRLARLFKIIQGCDEQSVQYLGRLAAVLVGTPRQLREQETEQLGPNRSLEEIIDHVVYSYGLAEDEAKRLFADYGEYMAVANTCYGDLLPGVWGEVLTDANRIKEAYTKRIPDSAEHIETLEDDYDSGNYPQIEIDLEFGDYRS